MVCFCMCVDNIMSAESGNSSGYMGAFQDFVQANAPEENSASSALANRPVECVMEPVAETSVMESDHNKPLLSSAKKRKADSDDSDNDTDSDVANVKSTSSDNEDSEPPAVPKRPRTQRSAKQKLISKMSGRGRGRGRGRSSCIILHFPIISTLHCNALTLLVGQQKGQ